MRPTFQKRLILTLIQGNETLNAANQGQNNFIAKLPSFLNSASKVTPRHKVWLLLDHFEFFDFFPPDALLKQHSPGLRKPVFTDSYRRNVRYQWMHLYIKQLHFPSHFLAEILLLPKVAKVRHTAKVRHITGSAF